MWYTWIVDRCVDRGALLRTHNVQEGDDALFRTHARDTRVFSWSSSLASPSLPHLLHIVVLLVVS